MSFLFCAFSRDENKKLRREDLLNAQAVLVNQLSIGQIVAHLTFWTGHLGTLLINFQSEPAKNRKRKKKKKEATK